MTAIEIASPPEVVWKHVVEFSEITEPPEWYFRMGVASPSRARIDGAGVGAIRHCNSPLVRSSSPSRRGKSRTAWRLMSPSSRNRCSDCRLPAHSPAAPGRFVQQPAGRIPAH